ncbi:MAG TPA: hypothetical protein PKN33_19545 [Phycisphaerae bacterium]|nr:hypothetical protein [Phycisphaerae bacterium]
MQMKRLVPFAVTICLTVSAFTFLTSIFSTAKADSPEPRRAVSLVLMGDNASGGVLYRMWSDGTVEMKPLNPRHGTSWTSID